MSTSPRKTSPRHSSSTASTASNNNNNSSSSGNSAANSVRASASQSVAVGDGLRLAVRHQPASFKLQVKNKAGRYVDSGGEHVSVSIRPVVSATSSSRSNSSHSSSHATGSSVSSAFGVKTTDNADGTYSVTYTPTAAGAFSLEVAINKRHVAGSPFALRVYDTPEAAASAAAARPDDTHDTTTTTTTAAAAAATGPSSPHRGSPRDAASSSSRRRRRGSGDESSISTSQRAATSPDVDTLRTQLRDLDARHRRLLDEHAAALQQLKQGMYGDN